MRKCKSISKFHSDCIKYFHLARTTLNRKTKQKIRYDQIMSHTPSPKDISLEGLIPAPKACVIWSPSPPRTNLLTPASQTFCFSHTGLLPVSWISQSSAPLRAFAQLFTQMLFQPPARLILSLPWGSHSNVTFSVDFPWIFHLKFHLHLIAF